MTKDEDFLTIEQASALLNISRRTLERYTQQGRVKRYRKGIRVYYRRSDVEQLMGELEEYQLDETEKK